MAGGEGPEPWLPDFETFARTVLGWSFAPKGYAGTEDALIPDELQVTLADYGETLQPDFAVRDLGAKEEEPSWQLLIQVLEPGQSLDGVVRGAGGLEASPHGRMERLLRRTAVKAGLLFNGRTIRLVSAPRGESSGWMDFRVAEMAQPAGRPICSAMRLLLGQTRLLSVPSGQRLAALLEDSRKFQNEVSERLAEQVLHALYEFLRGFQAAHDASNRELLRETLAEHPDQVYRRPPYRASSSRVPPLRGGAGHAAEGRDVSEVLLARGPLRATCGRTRPSTQTRWISDTAPGRSSWCCSG